MATAIAPMVHKGLRVHFGMQIKTLTACGELTHSPPEGDSSYEWPDVTCPKCNALAPSNPIAIPATTEKRDGVHV